MIFCTNTRLLVKGIYVTLCWVTAVKSFKIIICHNNIEEKPNICSAEKVRDFQLCPSHCILRQARAEQRKSPSRPQSAQARLGAVTDSLTSTNTVTRGRLEQKQFT